MATGADAPMGDQFTLLTSHGHVLFYLATEPGATGRQNTAALGLSQRRVIAVLHDLEDAGLLTYTRVGVRTHYEINREAHFRHPTLCHVRLGDVMDTIRPRPAGP